MSSQAAGLGFKFRWPSPEIWVKQQAGINMHGMWQRPHGHLHWTKHGPTFGPLKGRALMVHGYKGFVSGATGRALQSAGPKRMGVIRMDFSHNGHVPPFLERCLDEEAWSSNRHHIERDEVAYALAQIDDGDRPVMVMGHSRGWYHGHRCRLKRHMAAGGRLDGVSLWAPVSDLVSRFPQGEELRAWEASDRLGW